MATGTRSHWSWGLFLPFLLGACVPSTTEVLRPNVLVICIDVLRADHVGTYGYDRATTPSLDVLADSGVVFEAARSPAAWTKPSVPSYFTGRFPHQHGVYLASRSRDGKLVTDVLAPEEVTFAELFKAEGYRTFGVVANPTIAGEFGFAQGFDEYTHRDEDAEVIGQRFLDWLDDADREQPFFAYVHFNDVHLPYDPPGRYRTAFGDGTAGSDFSNDSWKLLKRRILEGKTQISDSDRQGMIDLYDGELKYTDAQIGEILASLEQRELLDETLIVVLSDHGEELLDRGGIDHGSSLYDELLGVPLIFRFPGGTPAGVRIEEPVSLVDVLPTLADYLGFETRSELAGHSLMPLLSGRPSTSEHAVYAEGIHGSGYQQSVTVRDWKYIVTVSLPGADSAAAGRSSPELKEAMRVEVVGFPAAEGRFIAGEVQIERNQDDERDKVTGAIEEIDEKGRGFLLLGYRVELDEDTRFQDPQGQPIEPNALHVGDYWKVYGRATSATSFEAEKVKRRASNKKKNKLEGRIASGVRKAGREQVFLLAGREVRVDRKAETTFEGEQETAAPQQTSDPWRDALERGVPLEEELYDLAADPGERNDLASTHRQKLEEMRSILSKLRAPRSATAAPTRDLDDQQVEALRSLGYIGSPKGGSPEDKASQPQTPKKPRR